jgi:hypothetical protein
MRALLLTAVFAILVAVGPAPAVAGDKAEKSPKAAASEVTLKGEMVCGKCVLHETSKCQNVLQVPDEGAKGTKTNYYLADNKMAKDNHEKVCSGAAKATVTGTVKEKAGKKVLTASTIKYE